MTRKLSTVLDIEATIVETIHQEMVMASQAAGMPDKFIENIKLHKISDTKYIIENAWEDNGKPLAVWFEYGTTDHWIEPRNPRGVLAFPKPAEGMQRHSSAIYFKSHKPDAGEMVFSKGHYVSGLPALEPMSRGFKIGSERMKERLNDR